MFARFILGRFEILSALESPGAFDVLFVEFVESERRSLTMSAGRSCRGIVRDSPDVEVCAHGQEDRGGRRREKTRFDDG